MADSSYIAKRSTRQKMLKSLVRGISEGKSLDSDTEDLLLNHYLRTLRSSSALKAIDSLKVLQVMKILQENETESILIPYASYGVILLASLALDIPRVTITNNYGPLDYCYQEMVSDSGNKGYKLFKSDFVSQKFQKELVKESSFDVVFVSIGLYSDAYKKITKETNVDTEREWKINFLFPLLLLSWKALDTYGKLYLHIDSNDYKDDIVMMMKSFKNIKELTTTKLSKESTIFGWKKTNTYQSYIEPERLIVANKRVYTFSYKNILETILTMYFRMIPNKLSYLVKDVNTSELIITALIEHSIDTDKELIFFVREDQLRLMKHFAIEMSSVQSYDEYNIAKDTLVNKTDSTLKKYYFVEDLDTNIHLLVLLTDALQQNLNDIPLIAPTKLWLNGDIILLQALIKLLPNTRFVYVTFHIVSKEPRTTMIQSNKSLKELWQTYGLNTDSLLEINYK